MNLVFNELLEPKPTTEEATADWLNRLLEAAEKQLPAYLILEVAWLEGPLLLQLQLTAPAWDSAERQYKLAVPITVADRADRPPRTVKSAGLFYSGKWLQLPGLRDALGEDFRRHVHAAKQASPAATAAVAILELHRLVRLRQRLGGSPISEGHGNDISALQSELATLLSKPRHEAMTPL